MDEENYAFYVGTNSYSYRQGEPAKILETITHKRDDGKEVVSFHVLYADGKHDYCVVTDYSNYKVLTYSEVRMAYTEAESK